MYTTLISFDAPTLYVVAKRNPAYQPAVTCAIFSRISTCRTERAWKVPSVPRTLSTELGGLTRGLMQITYGQMRAM